MFGNSLGNCVYDKEYLNYVKGIPLKKVKTKKKKKKRTKKDKKVSTNKTETRV